MGRGVGRRDGWGAAGRMPAVRVGVGVDLLGTDGENGDESGEGVG